MFLNIPFKLMYNMKQLFYFIIFCLIVASCTKSKDNPAPSSSSNKNNSTSILLDFILKKWNVSSTSSTRTASSTSTIQYKSFEFTKDSLYIITTSTDSIISGKFTLNSIDSVITLTNYGVLHILQIANTGIQFTLILNSKPTSVISVAAAPATPIVPSTTDTTTNKITRSWKLVKETVNGVENTAETTALSNGSVYAHVTFTEYSTYYTELYNGSGNVAKASGVWQWTAPGVQNRMCTADSLPISCSNNFGVSFDTSGKLLITTQSPAGVIPATVTIDSYQGY
jgi:hypothetical protein